MSRRRSHVALLLTSLSVILLHGLLQASHEDPRSREVRGLWVVRTTLTSPAAVFRMVEEASIAGFNTLLLQVRGRGDAHYVSSLEPRATLSSGVDPSFDPLELALREAHARGLRVLAWLNVNLVASAHELPADPRHVVNRSPEWLMVPRALAQELSRTPAWSPGYVGRLARWTRSQPDVEGLYVSPLAPGAVAHAVAVVSDVARRYDIDGIHLDYVRYPNADFDYSRPALEAFRQAVAPGLAAAERARLDADSRGDVLAYVDALPEGWTDFRRASLTAAVRQLREAFLRERPSGMVTAAVVADQAIAHRVRLQDWRRWVETGLLDAVCPMAYTLEDAAFADHIAETVALATTADVWAGIGAYRLSSDQTIARIATARRLGANGIVLFSYDSMKQASQPLDYLGDVARRAFADVSGSRP